MPHWFQICSPSTIPMNYMRKEDNMKIGFLFPGQGAQSIRYGKRFI